MGIETIGPILGFIILYAIWRLVTGKKNRSEGTPTDPSAPKGRH